MADRVRVRTEDETLEGVRIDDEQDDFLTLKLESGYNIGIDTGRVEDVTVLDTVAVDQETAPGRDHDSSLPEIALLHTGGTIASRVDYDTGAVVNQYDPEEVLALFPELHDIANISSELLANISSELMRFDHYNLMIEAVRDQVEAGVDGIIITHGTDTMHYSSAALSFALENVPVPVLFVGSQRSSDRPSTDAHLNLVSATRFIADSDWTGVGICMHASSSDDDCWVLPGTKVRKMHTSRRDAFRPVNADPVGSIDETVSARSSELDGSFRVHKFDTGVDVDWVRLHPHMRADEFRDDVDGVLLELFALGHAQTVVQDDKMEEHERVAARITEADMPVVGASQCLYGSLHMDVYSPGRALQELGVVGNHTDMTPETAFIKLAWLLSQYEEKEVVERKYCTDLRGEISDAESHDQFLC